MAVTGRVVVPLRSEPTDYELNESHLSKAEFVTANCFVRREVIHAIGGFCETFTAAWREDSDLHFRLLEWGSANRQRLIHCDQAVVQHPVRSAPWGISLRQQRKAQFNALLFKRHPRLYRQKIQRHPPWHYYMLVVAAIVAVAGFGSGRRVMAIILSLIWLAGSLHFCWRRLSHTSHSPGHVGEMLVTSLLIPFLAVFWRIYGALKFRVPFI